MAGAKKRKSSKKAETLAARSIADKRVGAVRGGSASSGVGAGKVTFNQFKIMRKVDTSSPIFFES